MTQDGFFSKSLKKVDDADLIGNYTSKKDLTEVLEDKRQNRKYDFSWKIVAIWTSVLGCVGCFAFLSYMTFPSYFVLPATFFSLLTGGATLSNERRIKRQNTMREVQNAMRSEVNRFAIENKILTKNIDQLESEVERLKPIERKLRGTVARNGDNTDKLVDLVAENRGVINEMKELLKAEVVQDMMAIVLDSDLDGDFRITEEETDILILRLSVVEGVVQINRRKMKEVLEQKGGSLSAIFDVIKNIMDDNQIVSEYDRIVTFDPLKRKPKKEAVAVPNLAAASSDSDATLWE